MKKYIAILLAGLLLCSCNPDRDINLFTQNDAIRLQVGKNVQFTYIPLTCQLSFSSDSKEFRANSDNMSDFFVADFSDIPAAEGQKLTADLCWTTETDILSRKNITLEVVKTEGEHIWLWSKTARIGLCIQMLE